MNYKIKNLSESVTIALNQKVIKMKEEGKEIVAFTVGEPDFKTPKIICESAIDAINNGKTKYTSANGIEILRENIANKLKRDNNLNYDKSQITVSNGAKQALFNALSAILDIDDEVLLPVPYWVSYKDMVVLNHAKPVEVFLNKENGYKVSYKILEKYLTKKTKALVINTPNNPSGCVYTQEELMDIAQFAIDNDIYIISDEIYEYLIYGEQKHISIASLGEKIYNRTITINGFSKSFAMTGWRVGYSAAPIHIAKIINKIQAHTTSNINTPSQYAALSAILLDRSYVDDMVQTFDKRRKLLIDGLSDMDFIVPQGAFYVILDMTKYIDILKLNGSVELSNYLLENYNLAVVPCDDFGLKNHIRLAYATSEENIKKGIQILDKFVTDTLKVGE